MTVITAPITKTLVLDCTPERAFAVFTEEMGDWWPLDTHRVHHGEGGTAVFEAREGGRIYETTDDGRESEWGVVLSVEAPTRLVFSWSPNPKQDTPTEIEVTFTASGSGTTMVLEHRGWERLGEGAEEIRAPYDGGWDHVLGRYTGRVSTAANQDSQ